MVAILFRGEGGELRTDVKTLTVWVCLGQLCEHWSSGCECNIWFCLLYDHCYNYLKHFDCVSPADKRISWLQMCKKVTVWNMLIAPRCCQPCRYQQQDAYVMLGHLNQNTNCATVINYLAICYFPCASIRKPTQNISQRMAFICKANFPILKAWYFLVKIFF